MLRFCLKIILFFLPVSLVFAFPLFVYWKAREFTPLEQVVKAQQGPREALFGLAYDFDTRTYKEDLVNASNAQIMVLGASRVMQFRSSFFTPQSIFVNAGGAIFETSDLVPFMQALSPQSHIKVIIVEMQENEFKPNNEMPDPPEEVTLLQKLDSFFLGNFRQPYVDYYFGKFTLGGLITRSNTSPAIGMSALINNSGFLNDGSQYDGLDTNGAHSASRIPSVNAEIASTIAQMQVDRGSFEYGTSTDPQSIAQVEAFLALCKERGIYVIGMMPPYVPALRQEMESINDAYSAEMYQLPKTLSTVFASYGFPLFDYTDAGRIGITNDEFFDEIHATDKADLQILIDMSAHNSILQHYVDLQALKQLLKNSPGDFVLQLPPS